MTLEINFAKEYTFTVDVFIDGLGEIGTASLTFGPSQVTALTFNLGAFSKLDAKAQYKEVKVTSIEGYRFTLINCEFIAIQLTAEFIVGNHTKNSFKLAHVNYTEAPEWFFQQQQVTGEPGDFLKWHNTPKEIAAKITTNESEFSITCIPRTSILSTDDGQLITNATIFAFERSTGGFRIHTLADHVKGLAALLSILLAYPISIQNVFVKCENGESAAIHFPYYKKFETEARRLDPRMDFFLHKQIFESNWQLIAQRFFTSKLRDPHWLRLAGMKRYNDFWEYKLLGYVTLLDAYVDFRSKDIPKKRHGTETRKITAFKAKLEKMHDVLNSEQRSKLSSLVTSVFGTQEHTFQEKFAYATSKLDKNTLQIINLSTADFEILKGLRDDIAHGRMTSVKNKNAERSHILVEKLTLLLTYLAFLDFGLSSSDFVACLAHSWNRIRRGSNINEAHLYRITKQAEFISVSPELLDELKQKTGLRSFCCFYLNADKEVEFSEEYTKLFHDELMTPRVSQDPNDFFKIPGKSVRVASTVYFESGEDNFQLNHVFLFEPSPALP
jgi:hypothetical protein